MALKHPPDPPRLSRLQKLRARQINWKAKRAARRAIFNRPTPVATYLLYVARLHRLTDLFYVSIAVVIGLRFLFRLSGADLDGTVYQIVGILSQPFLTLFEDAIPSVELGPGYRLELPALVALVAYSLLCQLFHIMIHAIAYRRRTGTDADQGNRLPLQR